jgi:hypothetical protein
MSVYKVLAEEIDGVDLVNPSEVQLSATNTTFAPVTASGPKPANPAIEVQTALVNSQAINNSYFASATAQVSTTSTTFQTDTALSVTPLAGTYAIWLTADSETTGVNCQGDFELFVDSSGLSETIRSIQTTTNILGLITLSTATIQAPIAIVDKYTFNGSQVLSFRYRVAPATSGAGSIQLNARTMLLIQLSL